MKLYTVITYFVASTANGRRKNDRADVIVMAADADTAIAKAADKLAKAYHSRGFKLSDAPDFQPTAIESEDGVIFT
jgi:hypothetical protein